MTATVNWSHSLLDGALDVLWAGAGTLTPRGSNPTQTATGVDDDIVALGGGDATSGYVLSGVPDFADHSGDMTITVVAMAHTATKGVIAGYDYYNSTGPKYGNLLVHINERYDNGYEQRGSLKLVFTPLRTGYAAPVIIGNTYNADQTGQPFYTANQIVAVSYAFTSGSSSDLRVVVDGVTKSSGYIRQNTMPSTDGTTEFSGVGLGCRRTAVSDTIAGPVGVGSILAIIVHGRKLTEAEQQSLTGDWEQIITISGGGATAEFAVTTADATFSGSGEVRPMASFAVTSAAATFIGSAAAIVSASISATAASSAFSGTATGDTTAGTITTPALKNNTGTVLANETGITAYIYTPDTGALVVKKTGQTTNASGVMSVTDAAIASSTQYRVVIVLGSGAEGMDKLTAS